MTRRHAKRRDRSLGQSLVEFALVVPVLLLFLMVAIDFGRVYLGWVNLQNMARIAANFAANNATGFATNNATTLAVYQRQILNDASATNCRLAADTAPPPDFSGYNVGDSATVGLTCSFGIVTPIISNILGDAIDVSASSQFPVKTGIIGSANTGGGGGGGTPVTASFSCIPKNGSVPMPITCNDESGGNPTSWSWTISRGGIEVFTSTLRDPTFTLTDPGTYDVKLIADNALNDPDELSISGYLTATNGAVVDFIADQNSGQAPLTVQFTDQSTNAPTAWAWDFDGNGSIDATIRNPTNVYTSPGTYDVTLTVTTSTGPQSVTKAGFILVSEPNCTVPSFTDKARSKAENDWVAAGFTRAKFTNAPGAPKGNFTVTFQSITAGTNVPCSSAIQVNGT